MTEDPWANQDPWATNEDTGPADPWSTEEAPIDDDKETSVTSAPVTVTSEDPITLTFKRGTGFEEPWTVIRAKSVDESMELLKEAVNKGLFKAVSWAAGEFAGTKGTPAPAQAAPQQSYQQAPAPPAAQQGPQGDGRTCTHGVMAYREGYNAEKGTHWKAYFCGSPKGTPNQCKAMFVK